MIVTSVLLFIEFIPGVGTVTSCWMIILVCHCLIQPVTPLLLIRQKWVIIQIFQSCLLDLLKREMSFILYPQLIVPMASIRVIPIRCILTVRVILFE